MSTAMPLTVPALQTALEHHQSGRLREAETIYRRILQADPRHFEALHLMGVLAHQSGQSQAAIAWISRAIALGGNQPAFHFNLGEVYRSLRQPTEAIQCFRQALKLNPDWPQTHHVLGTILRQQGDLAGAVLHLRQATVLDPLLVPARVELGLAHQSQGDLPDAADAFEQAVRLAPLDSDHRVNLGTLYHRMGRNDDAIACFHEAIRIKPSSPEAYHNLAEALKARGQLDEAVVWHQKAVEFWPLRPQAHFRLAVTLHALGAWDAAGESYRQAIRLDPDYVEALCNYGNLIQRESRLDEALEYYRRAIALQPDFAPAYFGRGNAYESKKMLPEAITAFEEAIRLQPEYCEAYNNMALALNTLVQPDEAVVACEKAMAIEPHNGAVYANIAIAYQSQGRGLKAIAAHRKAVELRPDDASEHSNLLFSLHFRPEYDAQALFAEHLEWARRHAEPLTAESPPHVPDRTPGRRLRIGYLSPFFRQHAVNYFSEPMIVAHDHDQFEIFCYSDVAIPDAATARLKNAADHWRDITNKTDDEAARWIREDRIDILVDLTGHIGANRLLIFARKPAPIQVTYLGYQYTTGMSAMDYRFTDAWSDPQGVTDALHVEQLVRLPRAFFCYQPAAHSPPVSALPAIENGFVTFGSFNNFAKITEHALHAWFTILARIPRSRLLVLGYLGGYLDRHLRDLARQHAIEPDRIEMCARRGHQEYLQLLARTDIALDPFPFNGHTTTCDLTWMGVPVVMLAGSSYASRFGGSVLKNVGLDSWITSSADDYIDTAVRQANDLAGLAVLRNELRPRMANSALLDFPSFTRNVEQAYRHMWLKWCDEIEN